MNNPFDSILDLYKAQVEEQDAKGDPEDFKKAAEALFDAIRSNGFNIVDVIYMDGYFIFGHGTNSVVHFYIDKCPGWRFGMWMEHADKTSVRAQIFAQYEDIIDKFKPSASSYCECIRIELGEHPMCYSADTLAMSMVYYISSHPELAWYRDLHFVDYNTEYVSEETAKEEFTKWKAGLELEDET